MSVEIFNWYEKQYPSDYRQLVKLKRYAFSELSFLLPQVWSQLDYAQKLLMCAVNNDDIFLARQLLRPGGGCLNPFWSRNYMCSWHSRGISTNRRASSTSAPYSPTLNFAPFDPFDDEDNDDEDDQEPSPEYFFNQRVDNIIMHSPFYFSVVLKRVNMCAFFIEFMKNTMRIDYLNHAIKTTSDLSRLVALALSNQSWDIAAMILENVEDPKMVLKFSRMSEYLVHNAQFCLFMLKKGIVEPQVLLLEATRRHAHSTTRLIFDYIESSGGGNHAIMIDLCRLVLSVCIEMGDQAMYAYLYAKLNSYLDASKRASALNASRSRRGSLTVHRIVESMAQIRRMSNKTKDIPNKKANEVRELALSKSFDYDHYERNTSTSTWLETCSTTSCLSKENRKKLMEVLFENSDDGSYWNELETRVRGEVESLERFFNRTPSNCNRQIYVHEWSPFMAGEPILVKNLLESDGYKISHSDLIRTVRESFSELTIHFLLSQISSFSQHKSLLLPEFDGDGNFMEHLFVRLCRERQRETRFALRRLFLDAVVNRDARMTCSQPLLELFLSDDKVHQYRLSSTYFPMLFLLAKSFRVFASSSDHDRFVQLTKWMHSRIFPSSKELDHDQIDIVLLEYYSHKCSHFKRIKTEFSFDLSLKELARRQFMKSLCLPIDSDSSKIVSKEADIFLNRVNDSFRVFIFYILDLANIFN